MSGGLYGDLVGMQSSTLNKALAATNLLNIGWNPYKVKHITSDWSKRQTKQSVERISREAAKLEVIDELGGDCSGKMFLSFHYSVYPSLYRALAKQSTSRTVYSLIGSQTPDHCSILQALARKEGMDIHFVQSGMKMISEMKVGLKRGHTGLILIDIPWSKQKSSPDRTYPAFGGSFESLSTIERLVNIIDEQREVVSVYRDQSDRIRLNRLGRINFSDAFLHLGKLISRDPADYERLHHLQHYFSFDKPKATLVSFRVKGQRYAVTGPSMRTVRISTNSQLDAAEVSTHGLCEDREVSRALSRALGENLEYILCL